MPSILGTDSDDFLGGEGAGTLWAELLRLDGGELWQRD